MEWLEFNCWSPEVERGLAVQAARLTACHPHPVPGPPVDTRVLAQRLQTLLRQHPLSNPWGHPSPPER